MYLTLQCHAFFLNSPRTCQDLLSLQLGMDGLLDSFVPPMAVIDGCSFFSPLPKSVLLFFVCFTYDVKINLIRKV